MSKDDREILSLIMKELEFNAPANLKSIRSEIANIVPAVANMGNITDSQTPSFKKPKEKIIDKPLKNIETNFYMTDPISRSSVTMAKCVKAVG
jgi:NADH-quinone oxidoreductase subunit G